jgi:hypothetical protein
MSIRDAREHASGKLSGFLSRIGYSGGERDRGEQRERLALKISGPMDVPPPSSGASGDASADEGPARRESTPNFGHTWSSLVDPSVLATMEPTERKRQEAIFEFIATEAKYVRDLQLVVGVFYARVMTILSQQALTVIFANIEEIMMFHSFFLSALEERQKECRLYVTRLGDILAEHCQNLSEYMPYCLHQDSARKLLVELRRTNPALEAALQDIKNNNPDVRGLDLSSFLLEPSE